MSGSECSLCLQHILVSCNNTTWRRITKWVLHTLRLDALFAYRDLEEPRNNTEKNSPWPG